MADDYSISYSYQSGSTTPAPTQSKAAPVAEGPLYAFIDCNMVNLQDSGVLLIHKHSDRQLVVAPEVSVALSACSTFKTLPAHVQTLCTTIPQLAGQEENVTQVLAMVQDAGLLTSAETMCERILPSDIKSAVNLPPTRIFVITCDRPAAAQRLLQSMVMGGNLTRHEQLFLVDDSRDPANAALNRQLVEKFNLNSPRDMQYVGADAQQALLDGLIGELPEQEQGIRFLIDRQRWAEHKTYGLARTLCLLLSVDCRAIVLDDDVICAAVPSPHTQTGVAFGNIGREVDFYQSEQDILARTSKADFDPLSGHASCLGLSLSQAMDKLGISKLTDTDLQEANGAYLSQWDADSPVLVTQSGTLGDPGTPETSWIYNIDKASAARLLASPGGLEAGLANRHYWMGQPRPTFSKIAVISQVTGLDNSHLLPPYFPAFRGEDYLFGAMVEFLHPQSTVLEYDWSVPHFPIDQREGATDVKPGSGKGDINPSKYVTDHTVYEKGVSPDTRLQSLAVLVKELSETSDAGLLALYRKEVAENQGNRMKQLTLKLSEDIPRTEPWNQHLQQTLNNVALAVGEVARLGDIPGIADSFSSSEIMADFHTYSGAFAESLLTWNDIRIAAKEVCKQMLHDGALAP